MSSYTESAVNTLVSGRVTSANTYADNARTNLDTYLTNLATLITTFTGTPIDFSSVVFPANYVPDTTLLTNINNSISTGKLLPTASEQALYDRATGRKDAENERLEDNALNLWANRNFELPGMTLLAMQQQIQNEQTRNNFEFNSEVLSQSGQWAYQAYEVCLKTAIMIEQLKESAVQYNTQKAATEKELILKDAELRIKEAQNSLSLQLESLKAGAQVNAQIVASALSSVNTSASYGFSGGWNENNTYATDLSKATVSETIVHNLSA